jgi:hypothetical protein
MKTLKGKLLSNGNLKSQDMNTISEIDSPVPINVKDLKLPSTTSVDSSKPMNEEDLKIYMFWKEILENNP